jgi:acyl dehydratase
MKIGDKAVVTKRFTYEDVQLFAEVSTDKNPLHLDETFASNTQFGKPIVHGMLVASLFSAILGTKLPGTGTIYLGQELSFKKPVFIGDTITASAEVVEMRTDKPICILRTVCHNSKGEIVIDGKAFAKYQTRQAEE